MYAPSQLPSLDLHLGGVHLKNPVLPASGTFGLGHGRVFDLNRLGALVPKTITPEPRTGHPAPRLAETAGGLINAIGIPSVGLERFLAEELPRWREFSPPLIVSLSADTALDFATAVSKIAAAQAGGQRIDGLELNLSCPNLESGGHLFASDPETAGAVVALCRAKTALPLWCKLTPIATDPAAVARACEIAGASALILTNTMPAMALGEDGRPRLANRTGGLSGPPLKPIVLRLVDQVAGAVSIPLVACGGVSGLSDLLDYFATGARAVAVGTATLARPTSMIRLIDALAEHLRQHRLCLDDLYIDGAIKPHAEAAR